MVNIHNIQYYVSIKSKLILQIYEMEFGDDDLNREYIYGAKTIASCTRSILYY